MSVTAIANTSATHGIQTAGGAGAMSDTTTPAIATPTKRQPQRRHAFTRTPRAEGPRCGVDVDGE